MKASMKARRAPKRDLFAELSQGMTALAEARQGRRTLRALGATLGATRKTESVEIQYPRGLTGGM
jgi:hypothetical protein